MTKIIAAVLLLLPGALAFAFAPHSRNNFAAAVRTTTELHMGGQNLDADMSGNAWKPTEGRMRATDTGDYLPEGYVDDLEFEEGMFGSQAGIGTDQMKKGPALPGFENVGEDAIMMGGIEVAEGIPEDMEFVPSSVPDGSVDLALSITSSGQVYGLEIKPFCMGYEDYYAAFAPGSHPCFSVAPATGRMDRRGGETLLLEVTCDPRGHAMGTFEADLVVNIPEDGSKLSYKFTAQVS